MYKGGLRAKMMESKGFTIVELLIVIVVIGILAAIVIVAFTGISNSAKVAGVKSDISGFKKKIEQLKVQSSDGLYPTATSTDMRGFKVTKNLYTVGRNNWYYCLSADRSAYAIGVAVAPGDTGYITSSTSDVQDLAYVRSQETGELVGLVGGSGCYSGYAHPSQTWAVWFN